MAALRQNWPIDASKISTVVGLRSSLFSCHSANFVSNPTHAVTEGMPWPIAKEAGD
jgi:hypothetical protein